MVITYYSLPDKTLRGVAMYIQVSRGMMAVVSLDRYPTPVGNKGPTYKISPTVAT